MSMGKEDEALSKDPPSTESVDPNDPVYWDEPTLRTHVAEWLFIREGSYRGDPVNRSLLLSDDQKIQVTNAVVKYWMPQDIDAVVLLAEEDDNAQEIARTSDRTFAFITRRAYQTKLNDGLTEREALGQVKNLVADRLSDRDLKGLPSIAPVHTRQMINQLAHWKPRPKFKNPYSKYL